MSLFSSVSDMYLRRHIRSLLERYYALQGINMKDLERKTNRELIDLLKKVLENQESKINELQLENDTMHKKAEKMQDRNKDLELKNDQLYDRNEKLIKSLRDSKEVSFTLDNENKIKNFKFFKTIKDIFKDGTTIKKDTEFIIDKDFGNGNYELHFSEDERNKYKNEYGDDYIFSLDEMNEFSKPVISSVKNYKHEVLRGLDGELNMETEKHMVKLQRCNTKTEAAAEVAFHMSREYFIREKYKEHGLER
jgi:hypothetical protein